MLKGIADSFLLPTILLRILHLNRSHYNGHFSDVVVGERTILGFEIITDLGYLFAFHICSAFWIQEGFRATCDFALAISLSSCILYFFTGGLF